MKPNRQFGNEDFDTIDHFFLPRSHAAAVITGIVGPGFQDDISPLFLPSAIVGALVLEDGTVGNTDESTSRLSPSIPRTRRSESTTANSSLPILQLPTYVPGRLGGLANIVDNLLFGLYLRTGTRFPHHQIFQRKAFAPAGEPPECPPEGSPHRAVREIIRVDARLNGRNRLN